MAIREADLAGFGAQAGYNQDGHKLYRLVVETRDGHTLHANFSNGNELLQHAGMLFKVAADEVTAEFLGTPALKTQTHVPAHFQLVGPIGKRVLVIRTTDNSDLHFVLDEQSVVQLRHLLT